MSWNEVFLQAEWRSLAMLNYETEPSLLVPFIPAGTELDSWHGKFFVSLVGFRFLRTEVRGISIPLHRNFEEVNLRFYVRRWEDGELRRGVVFIREIVPRLAIAAVARMIYGEKYVSLPMNHTIETIGTSDTSVEYRWCSDAGWNCMSLRTEGHPFLPKEDSEEQFITEHYWGYAVQRGGRTAEYRVDHAPWRVWKAIDAKFDGDMTQLYGGELAVLLQNKPFSAFLAEGSGVKVFRSRKLDCAGTERRSHGI